ncbi:carboxy terminal-processing peptidase [Namhaeicola litoreus]|uniref:Carboxy terminal-processing peptidase n=1 Tax=Namhaeicola litoreus TaxID=1052145 RepID=A0ABW3Y0B6_9FLAO
MLSKLKYIFLLVILGGLMLGFQVKNDEDPEKEKILLSLIRYALTKGHYEPIQMNDEFSEKVYDEFLNNLDPSKRLFLQQDIDEFSQYKYLIDDQIKNEDLTFFNLVYEKYNQRLGESKKYYKEILSQPFDFNKNKGEIFSTDYESKPYAANEAELIQTWRDQLKITTLTRLYDKIELDENRFEKDSSYTKSSIANLEIEAREGTLKSMDDFFDFMEELERTDWFSIYINSVTLGFDPHTSYFAPKDKKRFDISMAGKLEGIGARLRKKDDYTTVDELISGGPAWRGGELEVGDAILKVAQGDGEPIDIIGMRLDDAIEFIKGKKGTEVKLTVLKIDGSLKVISIVRDIVEIDETFAKSTIIKKGDKKYGLIELPKFYIDFNEKDYRNSTTDMELEIERLKKENVDGILLDLRNNGGGSLKTAIEIAGLFIKEGPVVQVKYRDEKPVVKSDTDKKVQYDGPLVVLVNELSASASEIFAAAMQDYNRAVILGSKQTFGKGTVQNLLPLNNYYKYEDDLGALKMTIQKFYRINGGSTQIEGVTSDIAMPDRYSYMEIGERDEKNPLEWDKVAPANYIPLNYYENFSTVINESKQRILENENFKLIDENAKWLKAGRDDDSVHLNFDDYKKEITTRENEAKLFDKLNDYKNDLEFYSPAYEIAAIENDSILGKKREIWHENLNKDIYVDEAINVLSSLKIRKENLLVKN